MASHMYPKCKSYIKPKKCTNVYTCVASLMSPKCIHTLSPKSVQMYTLVRKSGHTTGPETRNKTKTLQIIAMDDEPYLKNI